MENEDRTLEEVCGLDKKCQKKWLKAQTDCI
jgi:hypothetical protein